MNGTMDGRVTLRDIAKRTGYHYSTVSLAMRDDPRIQPETRATIRRIAEELKYRPDPMLARLAAYRRRLPGLVDPLRIAYLINWPSHEQWRSEHCEVRFFAGAKKRAEELGYQLEEVWPRELKLSGRRLGGILLTRNYDGLLVSHTPKARGHLTLDWSKLCAVKIGHSLVYPRLACVENDQYRIMQLAVRTLRRKGYRRIGLAMRASQDELLNHMFRACYLVETGRPRVFEPIPPLVTARWDEATFQKWYHRYQPEVVLSVHLKVLDWLRHMKLRVPEQVGFVDLDCADRSGARAGIYQHHEQVGALALETLEYLIQRNHHGIPAVPQITILEGAWLDGATLRDHWVRKSGRSR